MIVSRFSGVNQKSTSSRSCAEIEAARLVVAGEVDVIPDPVEIDGGIDAVVLEQRHGDAGNGRGFHVGKRALQHAEAAHADDRLDLPGLDERHDDRAAFRDEHRVAEPLGFRLQILDRAEPALFAEQAEFIERRGAFALHAQALRQQQQPALERHAGELLAPHFVVQQHADVIAVDRLAARAARPAGRHAPSTPPAAAAAPACARRRRRGTRSRMCCRSTAVCGMFFFG